MIFLKRNTCFLPLLTTVSLFVCLTEASHNFSREHHFSQRAPQAPATPAVPISSDNSIIADVSEILDGLKALPQDVSKFIQELFDSISQLSELAPQLTNPSSTAGLDTSGSIENASSTSLPGLGALTPQLTVEPSAVTTALSNSSTNLTTTYKSTVQMTRTLTVEVVPTSPSNNMSLIGPSAYSTPQSRSVSNISTFDGNSMANIAAYFNLLSSPSTQSLRRLCDDPAINIIMLGFVDIEVFESGSWGVSGGCAAEGCIELGAEAQRCQTLGKKVLASILSNTTLDSSYYQPGLNSTYGFADIAEQLAEYLWRLFGADYSDPGSRAWGNFSVDGFDIYPDISTTNSSLNRTNSLLMPPYDTTFINALRLQFANDTSRHYYLSAAPPCLRPDVTLGLDALQSFDFVYVRFYDSPQCEFNSQNSNLRSTISSWSQDLMIDKSNYTNTSQSAAPTPTPKLFLGVQAPNASMTASSNDSTTSMFESFLGIFNPISESDQGGLMLWGPPEDVERAWMNGTSFATYAKSRIFCSGANEQLRRCG